MAGTQQELNLVIQARNQAQSALNGVAGQLDSIKTKAQSISEQMSNMSAGVATAGAGLTAGLTLPILGLAKASIQGAAEQEQLRVAFTTMLGDAGKAKKLIADLQQFAAATPFEQDEVVEAGKKLLAFGINAEDVQKTLLSLGDIAAGVGIPIQDLATIYGKAQVAGRVMTGDINQLVGRGVPIIKALAKELGVTEEEVSNLAEKGQISFENLKGAMGSLTSEGGMFSGMMSEQSKTLLGMWSTVKDQISITLNTIGEKLITTFNLNEKLAGAIEWLTKFREGLLSMIEKNPELFQMVLIFAGIAAALGPALIALAGILRFVSFLAPAISAVGAAASLLVSPIALIAIGIGILLAYDVGGWGTAVGGAFSAVGTLVSEISGSIPEIKNWIDAVTDAGFRSSEAEEAMSILPTTVKKVAETITTAVGIWEDLRDAMTWIFEGKAEDIDWWYDISTAIGSITGMSTEASDKLGDFLYEGGVKVQEFIKILTAAFGPTIERLFGNITAFGTKFSEFGAKIQEVIGVALPLLQNLAMVIGVGLGIVAYAALNILSAAFDSLDDVVAIALDTITGLLGGFGKILEGAIKVVVSLFNGDWKGAWDGAKTMVEGWSAGVITMFNATKNVIGTIVQFIGTLLTGILGDFGMDTTAIEGSIKSIVEGIKGFTWPQVPAAIQTLVTWVWPEAPTSIDSLVKWAFPIVPSGVTRLTSWLFPAVSTSVANFVAWSFPEISATAANLIAWAFPKISDSVQNLLDWDFPDLPDLLETLLDWTWPTLPIPQSVLDWLGSSSPPAQAVGAGNWSGGPMLVGDGGPEVIIPPRGSRLLNNREAGNLLSGSGGLNITINNPTVRSNRDIDLIVDRVIAEVNRRRN
jgi:tape measure domain-containing protein